MAMLVPPCFVGDSVHDIETPALVVQLDTLEKNLEKMADIMKSFPGVNCRPHAKAHKCAALAHMQMSHGAIGVCCQTITEVETMVNSGLKDVFLSNEIVTDRKLKRFAALAKMAKLSMCLDCEEVAENLNQVAKEMNMVLHVLVESLRGDVGQLAQKITCLPFLNFNGLQCYNGKNQHIRSAASRKHATDEVAEKVKKSLAAVVNRGIQCRQVTGGGTGTFRYEAASVFSQRYSWSQGSYAIMDVDYGQNLDEEDKFVGDFDQSLYVLCTVISVAGTKAVTDAGLKALSVDSGKPKVLGRPDVEYSFAGDEHGALYPRGEYKVGDKVWLIPGHCDPTVNLFSHMVGIREDHAETAWLLSH